MQKLEGLFVELLSDLRPEPGYMRLFKEIVRDVWRQQESDVKVLRDKLEGAVRELRAG